MEKIFFLMISNFLVGTTVFSQIKVANYSFGKPGTDMYEHFEFWTNEGKHTTVSYVYGKEKREVKLHYVGRDVIYGDTCFRIRFTNNYVLSIMRKGLQLRIFDQTGKYDKIFSWEYEGPVNGIGTFCEVCAEDERAAMTIIKLAYLQ